jgi:hypothetical protein
MQSGNKRDANLMATALALLLVLAFAVVWLLRSENRDEPGLDRGQRVARFANYDVEPLTIHAPGDRVLIGLPGHTNNMLIELEHEAFRRAVATAPTEAQANEGIEQFVREKRLARIHSAIWGTVKERISVTSDTFDYCVDVDDQSLGFSSCYVSQFQLAENQQVMHSDEFADLLKAVSQEMSNDPGH